MTYLASFPRHNEIFYWLKIANLTYIIINIVTDDCRLKTDDSIVTDAVVRYDGLVTWIRPIIYTVTSRHEFRGNSWSATLKFSSWTYDATLLDLQPLPGAFSCFHGLPVASNDFQPLPGTFNLFQGLPVASWDFQPFPGTSSHFQGLSAASRDFRPFPRTSSCFQELPVASNDFQPLPGTFCLFQGHPVASRGFQFFFENLQLLIL